MNFNKPPVNQNIENPQELKEKKIKTLEIKVGNQMYSLEAESYDFEYPEAIQKETGIIGYERTIISKDSLLKIHKETGRERGKDLTKQILSNLSEDEFFNLARHEMGWYAGPKEKEVYSQKFADQKFILQKIFDIDGIEELKKESGETTFSHGALDSNQINFSLFDKGTFQVIEERISPNELPKYKEKIDSGEFFLCTTSSGLSDRNIVTGKGYSDPNHALNLFWDKSTETGRKHFNIISEFPTSPVFAFDPESPILHKYFSEMYNLYVELNKANHTNIVGGNYDVLHNLYEKAHYKESIENKDFRNPRLFLRTIEEDFKKDSAYEEKDRDTGRDEIDEGAIPIIIGHDKIKQLRWGDSKYAVFHTAKGLNFLKIKHAEHLPEK